MLVSPPVAEPPAEPVAALRVGGLTKRYGPRLALDGVSLELAAGEVVGLLGPNGAGKTTLVSIVAGLRRADGGTVHVAGLDVAASPRRARALVGYAPQDSGVYEVLTVHDNLRFFGELVGLRRRALATRIDEVATALRLESLMARVAHELSGGEKRRLHTAIAFLHRPPLLLLDEPTVGADIETRAALLETVRAQADDGSAIVYSTHYLPEVESLHASVAILDHGRFVATGRVDDLVARYGVSAAQLTFDGSAPACAAGDAHVVREGNILRVAAVNPATAAAELISRLGPETRRLRDVELIRPSLDSVFLAITGRRYGDEMGANVTAA
jgi:ABC-type multidrug transport system ATPase subunit